MLEICIANTSMNRQFLGGKLPKSLKYFGHILISTFTSPLYGLMMNAFVSHVSWNTKMANI